MVKSYQRFEQADVFGVVTANSNCVWLPSQVKNSPGQVITGALEEVKCWEIKTGELLKTMRDGLPPGAIDIKAEKPAEATYLQYHEETSILAVGYADGTIKIWDMQTQTVLIVFHSHNSAVTILRFDQTGTRLISGSRDATIIVWDLVAETGLCKLRSHKDAITGIWCENDDWLISVSKDGLVKIWDMKVHQCVETHMAHTGECWSLAVRDNMVITANAESELKLWELDLERPNGSMLLEKGSYEKQSKQRCTELSFTTVSDGTTFFYSLNADKTMEIFRIRSETEIAKALKKREKRFKEKGMSDEEIQESFRNSYANILLHPFQVVRSLFKLKASSWTVCSPTKLELVVTTANNTIEYYSIPYKKKEPVQPTATKLHSIESPGHRTDLRAADISSDDKLLATASNGNLKIWNIKTKTCIRNLECGYALCCKFLPGGALVILGTRAGQLQLFDLASSTMLENIEEAHTAAIWSLDLTSDGKRLVTASADKTVKFWDFKVEQELVAGTADKFVPKMKLIHDTTLDLGEDLLCVKISPEDKFLAVSLLDNTVKVFFLDSMKFFLSLYGHKLPVLSMDISHDSKLIITSSADKNIKVWGLDFGDCHKSLFAHQDSIMNVKFVPESHNFFSCSKDGTVKYWDGNSFDCIQKLYGHQGEVWALAVSSDGQSVVSVSHDRSIRIWEETDDQVFLEEEREKELEEQYEKTLLTSLEGGSADDAFVRNNEEDAAGAESTEVHKQTIESLKAGERVMEALDLGISEIEAWEQYEQQLKLWNKKLGDQPTKPQSNAILAALDKTPEAYVMETLTKIKPSQLEDALLILPFSYVLKFLKFIDIAIKNDVILQKQLPLLCKILIFVVRSNHRELVSQKNEELKMQINRVKDQLRAALRSHVDDLGFNIQGLKFVRNHWNINHNYDFNDEYDQLAKEKVHSKKRLFPTF
ncbi:AaceriAGL196Cp [[Ashbya] aceris (nom. inval.)]|nr:AaceriAGL196Cp [[Ashbya] aceris (nom. inval.)]